jgi:hypothetical protein
MRAQVSSLVVNIAAILVNELFSYKEIFTMSLRNGPHIWFLNWLNYAPIMLCTLRVKGLRFKVCKAKQTIRMLFGIAVDYIRSKRGNWMKPFSMLSLTNVILILLL